MADNVDFYATTPPSQPPPQNENGNNVDFYAHPNAQPTPRVDRRQASADSYFGGSQSQQPQQQTNHSFLQELFGVSGVWQEVGNAMTEGRLSGKGEFSKIHEIFQTDPASAMDKFGLNSKDFLQYVVQHAPANSYEHKWAAYNLAHPTETGWETFGGNFLPGMNVGGGPLGQLGKFLHGWLSSSEAGRAFLHIGSPFKGIAKVAGDAGKHALQAMVNSTRHVDDLAMRETQRILGGLNLEEQKDVVRRMQFGKLIPHGTGQARLPNAQQRLPGQAIGEVPEQQAEGGTFVPGLGKVQSKHNLDQRAQMLNQVLRATTKRRVEEGTLRPTGVHNEQAFFPMKGAYRDPRLNDDEFDFIEQLRTGHGGGAYTIPPNYHKTYTNIDEALNSGLLRDDFSPAHQLYRHLSRSNQNIAANRAIGSLPSTLIRHPDRELFNSNPLHNPQAVPDIHEVRGGKALIQDGQTKLRPPEPGTDLAVKGSALAHRPELPAKPEQDIYSAFYKEHPSVKSFSEKPPAGWVAVEHVFPGDHLLPNLKGAWLKKEFADWLKKHGGSSLTGQPIKLFNSEGLAQWVHAYNSGMRQAIVANPAYHLLWNIAWNGASAMGSSPLHLVETTARALLGTARSMSPALDKYISRLGDGNALKRFMEMSNDWANDVQDAIRYGATAEFGASHAFLPGAHAADLFTRPYSDLSFAGKMNKLFSEMSDWNKRAVFDRNGEQAVATRLFTRFRDRLTKQGYSKEKASGTAAEWTRQALGNYQNVDPNNQFAQFFFFYPWLKSNSAYWIKTFLRNPAYGAAPLEGIRRHNEIAGDPNLEGQFPTQDYTIYEGTNPQGGASYWTPPLPQRMAGGMINAAATGSPDEMSFETGNVLGSHANPILGSAANWWATVQGQRHDGQDPAIGSNYDYIWDKDAPRDVQIKQIGQYAASHALPIPLVQYAVQDALRTGMDPRKFAGYLLQSAGAGFPHSRPTQQQSKRINKVRAAFERTVHQQTKLFQSKSITKQQLDARIARAYKLYTNQRDDLLNGSQSQQQRPEY